MSVPETPPSPAPVFSRQEKERLLQKMYGLPHWIAIIRLFGYRTLTMEKARAEIKPIAEEYGKEKAADACEVLVEIVPGKEPLARLKAHVRRMAFQLLGPEPTAAAPTGTASPVAPPESEPPRLPEKKRRPRAAASAPRPVAVKTDPAPDGQSAIMAQYRAAKEKHPEMVLLFRIGDFLEAFEDDADTLHRLLGLTLTTRDRETKMAGFPHHQLETYLHKLLKEGQRVAICEPTDDSVVKGPIKREVTRVVTPAETVAEKPVIQPRHFVLKKFEEWMNQEGLAFVAIEDVKKSTPDAAKHVAGLDFIVLRGEEKLLVTVRPHLQTKHLKAIAELQKLFGAEYKPVRVWPTEGQESWNWQEHEIEISAASSS